ncbi:large conductance mechanosensitive channel protein MscL [Paenibacillus yanchengensis]|uniref:Large-conductance mechanosensitive channel n=1 Tax=Paenibacillus yanchengensis TaxID=2035833 RepID=A0ABW4YGD6_9BACL
MKIMKEFREFAVKGNVIDLAVGVIIGGAFGKIVTSLVNDMIMPLVGRLLGQVNFKAWKIPLVSTENMTVEQIEIAPTLYIGQFLNTLIDFLIIAFCIFLMVKGINTLRNGIKKEEPAVEAEPVEKDCPFCFSQVPIKATRCKFCTSELEQTAQTS